MRIFGTAAALFGMTLVATPAWAQSLGSFDRDFVANAASACRYEVALGKLAETRGRSDAVRQFGTKAAHDYGLIQAKLEVLARAKGLDLPPPPKGAEDAALLELATLEGAAFDDGYMAAMQRQHDTVTHAFEREAQTGDDGDWRGFAQHVLWRLQADDAYAHLYIPQR